MPVALTLKDLSRARAARNLLEGGSRVRTDAEAIRFIEQRGFVLLMPIEGVPLPSLSAADDERPWSDDFRCTSRAWDWKETLPAGKLCAYGKLIRNRGTFISWRLFPAFLAAYGPAGDPDEEYEAGRLGRNERSLIGLVAESGPLDSHDLWRKAKPIFGGARHRFLAALDRLQSQFYLTVAGGSTEGWSLHTWDLVERQAPGGLLRDLPNPSDARRAILAQTLVNAVAMPEEGLGRLLRWNETELRPALTALSAEGHAVRVEVAGERGSWVGDGRLMAAGV